MERVDLRVWAEDNTEHGFKMSLWLFITAQEKSAREGTWREQSLRLGEKLAGSRLVPEALGPVFYLK